MLEKSNPFNISFGEEPTELIKRTTEFNEIVEMFNSPTPISKALIISGVHGVGKTILLAQVFFYSIFLIKQ